jgi:hypothetical protein
MVTMRGGQPDRLGGHRLRGRDSGSGRVSRDRRLALVRVLGSFRAGAGLNFREELVHDLGAGSDDGPQFAAVRVGHALNAALCR